MPPKTITAQPATKDQCLTDAQVHQWRDSGYAFVSGLLPEPMVAELAAAAGAHYPSAGSTAAAEFTDFGSAGALNFPARINVFNQITLHPQLLQVVSDLLGVAVETLRLSQSDLWPKYGRKANQPRSAGLQDNADQRIHVDYPHHSLVHPPPWHRPEAVEMILYLSDAEDELGGTAVVPRSGANDPAYRWPIIDSPGIGDLRYINNREAAETYFASQRPDLADFRQLLYEREVRTLYRRGDLLLYRHDTWHRGTPLAPGARRLAHNLTYRKAASEWISTLHTGWAWQAYRDDKFLERLIAGATVDQRTVLGFPAPGSDYWCSETLAAVEARYGMFGFDIAPYIATT